ncbi:MAG: hypothetical protein ABJA16_10955, partial [Nakamurella sp.]
MRPRSPRPDPARLAALLAVLTLAVSACGSGSTTTSASTTSPAATAAESGAAESGAAGSGPADWDSVLAQAQGQTVNWYMYGGDDTLNAFVTGYLADRLAAAGVTLDQVPVTDTVDAVNKVLGEVQAGRTTDGSVDLVWVNGENFATGVQA